jgi:EAL domain-containing protein (putative c-di-GMP-specific phosphodiesterase class I)/AmiR/NasT family two-component response regulator
MKSTRELDILLVDDEPFVLSLASKVLEQLGQKKVDLAKGGDDALIKIMTRDTPYDLVIADLNMPDLDGVELLRLAHDSGFKGGVILLSGEDQRMLDAAYGLAKAHNVNVLGALSKPLNKVELSNLLSAYTPQNISPRLQEKEPVISKAALIDGLKGSAEHELVVLYQPVVSLQNNKIVGIEANPHWWSLERGTLDSSYFMPRAKIAGLVDEVTLITAKNAVIDLAAIKQSNQHLSAWVKLNIASLGSYQFREALMTLTADHDISNHAIVLEVRETQAINLSADIKTAMMQLRLKRFGLAIDAFGTGSASLSHLQDIPFSIMNIDQTLVQQALETKSGIAILESSIKLAKNLNLEISTQGIEHEEQLELVRRLGCDYVIGDIIAKAMRAQDIPDFLERWKGLAK